MTNEETKDLLARLKDVADNPPEIVDVDIVIRKGDKRVTLHNSFAAHTYRDLKAGALHQNLFAHVLTLMGKELEPHLDLLTEKPNDQTRI